MKTIKSKLILFTVILFLTITAVLLTSYGHANARTDGNDKLYGETLSSRAMPMVSCPSITAQYACIINKKGDIIYERNAYDSAKIASLTKIMTAVVAIENFNLDKVIEVSEKAVKVGESSAGLWVGDKLDMQSALYAMLVPSGNDAAQAIAEGVGQGLIDNKDDRIRKKSVEDVEREAKEQEIDEQDVKDVFITDPEEVFVKLMNIKAAELGCVNTNFTNPHGLADDEYADDNEYSCAMDIAFISKYAMQNDLFRKIVGGGSTSINVERYGIVTPLKLDTTDILLESFEGCIGVKTGNTNIGGPCFSGAYHDAADGDEIYAIVLKSDDETQRFVDTQDLFNWYISNKVSLDLTDTNDKQIMVVDDTQKEVGVVAYIKHNDWIDDTIPVTLKDEDKAIPVLVCAGNVHMKIEQDSVSGSYKAGDKCSELVLTQHNKEIARLDLISIKDKPAPNVFQFIGVAFDKLCRNISGNNTGSDTKLLANCDKVNNQNTKQKGDK